MLPLAFNEAGLILAVLFMAFCSFLAFICVTYVIEVMACSNALLRQKENLSSTLDEDSSDNEHVENSDDGDSSSRSNNDHEHLEQQSSRAPSSPFSWLRHKLGRSHAANGSSAPSTPDTTHLDQGAASDHQSINKVSEDSPLLGYETRQHHETDELLQDVEKQMEDHPQLSMFSIVTQTELGLCAEQFLGRYGKALFYLVIIMYLYGDLAIYAVSVPKSVLQVSGELWGLSDTNTFRFYALIFSVLIVPICYLNFSKTKYLQLFTLAMRNIALALMIILSLIFIFQGRGASWNELNWFNLGGIKTLYGVTIYSFMCHHSLPGIVSPIRNKRRLGILFMVDFLSIFSCYILLCYTAMFAFGHQKHKHCPKHIGPSYPCQIQELFTYNFTSYNFAPVGYFLALFPVFTLSTNFPLIAMTLRGNIQTLFKDFSFVKKMHWLPKRLIFSSLAALPPVILVFFYQDVTKLASLTGGFAGLGIQFFFPAFMVFSARRKMMRVFKTRKVKNPHASWFKSFAWVELVVAFATVGLLYQITLQVMDLVNWMNGGFFQK